MYLILATLTLKRYHLICLTPASSYTSSPVPIQPYFQLMDSSKVPIFTLHRDGVNKQRHNTTQPEIYSHPRPSPTKR